jgi:hypothetical protein
MCIMRANTGHVQCNQTIEDLSIALEERDVAIRKLRERHTRKALEYLDKLSNAHSEKLATLDRLHKHMGRRTWAELMLAIVVGLTAVQGQWLTLLTIAALRFLQILCL